MYLQNELIVVANIFFSSYAIYINHKAYKAGLPKQRMVYLGVAIIATFYTIAWVWLLLLGANDEVWTSIMRGFTLLAWALVWIRPARVSLKTWAEIEAAVLERLEREAKDDG